MYNRRRNNAPLNVVFIIIDNRTNQETNSNDDDESVVVSNVYTSLEEAQKHLDSMSHGTAKHCVIRRYSKDTNQV